MPSLPRTFLTSVRDWFTHGAEAEKAGLKPGWHYLDVHEFAETSPDPHARIEMSLTKSQSRAIAFDSLADIVDDVIAETEFEGAADPTQAINKRGRRIVSVISGKGGVGKTSVALGLAGAAATRGLRVVAVDLDPQGSLTLTTLGPAPQRSV